MTKNDIIISDELKKKYGLEECKTGEELRVKLGEIKDKEDVKVSLQEGKTVVKNILRG